MHLKVAFKNFSKSAVALIAFFGLLVFFIAGLSAVGKLLSSLHFWHGTFTVSALAPIFGFLLISVFLLGLSFVCFKIIKRCFH